MPKFFIFLLFTLCSCTNKQFPDEQTSKLLGFSSGVIDAHLHTVFDGEIEPTSGIVQSYAELKSQMLEAGVVGGIAHVDEDGSDYHELKSDQIFHCIGVGAKPKFKEIEQDLASGKYKCIKVYLGYVHQFASHPNYLPLYELAKKYDVPVVFHTGDTYSATAKVKYADPLTIDEVAVDFPQTRMVLAHMGNPWIQSATEVAYKNHNVFLDGSALLIRDLSNADPQDLEDFLIKPVSFAFRYSADPRKIIFGTDWPLTRIAPYLKAFSRAIPKEHHKDVFRNNAIRVFKLPLEFAN